MTPFLQYRTKYPRIVNIHINHTPPSVTINLLHLASYPELVAAAILKGFKMRKQIDDHIILGRRKLMLATLALPLLIVNLRAVKKSVEIDSTLSIKDHGFIVLGGWVLLKEDLIGNIGRFYDNQS